MINSGNLSLFLFTFINILHRATLRRAYAISTSTKNPPLEKTRNIMSQNSIVGGGVVGIGGVLPTSTTTAAVNSSSSSSNYSAIDALSTSATPCQALLDEYAASAVKESDV